MSSFRLRLWPLLLALLPLGLAYASGFDSSDPAVLDSLVTADRYGCYQYLAHGLEEYFQSGSPELQYHLQTLADLAQERYGDNWFQKQLDLYTGWNSEQKGQRRELLAEFAALNPRDTGSISRRGRELASGFLQLSDSAAAAKVYHNAGLIMDWRGDKDSAATFLAASLQLARAAGDQVDQARAYSSLGSHYIGSDSLLWAGSYFDSAMTIRAELGDSLGVARSLSDIGTVYLHADNRKRAKEYFTESLRISENGGDSAQAVEVLLNLCGGFWRQESEETLAQWLNEAQAFAGSTLSGGTHVRMLQAEAQLAQKRGDWRSAASRLSEALGILPLAGQSNLRLSLLVSRASLFNAAGDYDSALAVYLKAYDLAVAGENQVALADILHNLGATAQRLGQHESAADYYLTAVNLNRKLGRVCAVAATLNNLIEVYLERSEPEAAQNYLQELRGSLSACDDPQIRAQSCLTLAQMVSPTYLDTALAYFRELDDRQGELRTLIEMAESQRRAEKFDQARRLLDSAAFVLRRVDVYENRQLYELSRGLLAYDSGNLDTAYAYLARVISRLESTRRKLPEAQLRVAQQSRSRFVYETMTLLWWKRSQAGLAGATDSLLFYLESAKSRSLLDLLSEQATSYQSPLLDSLQTAETSLLHRLESQEQHAMSVRDSTERAVAFDEVDSLDRQLGQLRLRIGLADPRSSQAYQPQPIPLRQLQEKLPDSTLLLDYLLTTDRSLLVAIDRNSVKVMTLPDRAALADRLIDYLRLLRNSATIDSLLIPFSIATDSLTEMVLGDVLPDLHQYKRLEISPDGPLAVLPFGALRDNGHYVAEDLETTYLPSLYLLGGRSETPSPLQSSSLLAVAVPDAKGMASLRYSREEVDSISQLFDPQRTRVLIGAAAAKQLLQSSKAQDFEYLHFATHSSINHEDPLRSRLWLSADTAGVNAYLSLADVMRLRLHAELVTLSSCESGSGRYHLGEGIEGFVRGFLYAGADRVLVSLWPVEDLATMEFMVTFYDHLQDGYGAALRETKLRLIHSPRLRLRQPYYWSPFILVEGD